MVVIDNPPTSDFPAEETSTKQKEAKDETRNDVFYKTKTIKFLGGTKNIILQNDNGPCPLIAMCNVLLLRNDMNLYPIVHDEVSEEGLLALVANALFELNSFDFESPTHDDEYIANQRKKMSDAMNLLPCLANGINVDVKFQRIDEFESTPELTTFELLKIPLYHGWIFDPKDSETATVIGSKSYNDLITDLVVLKSRFPEAQSGQSSGESSVNFSESITSTLGVPSQCCSITTSVADIDEQTDLLQALTLSKREALGFDICSEGESLSEFLSKDETLITSVDAAAGYTSTLGSNTRQESKFSYLIPSRVLVDETVCDVVDRIYEKEEVCSTTSITKNSGALDYDQKSSTEFDESVCEVETESSRKMTDLHVTSPEKPISIEETNVESTKDDGISEITIMSEDETLLTPRSLIDVKGKAKVGDVNPYGAEVCVFDSPFYEGESLLGESSSERKDTNVLTLGEGEVITRFLRDNGTQLTLHGLHKLKEGLIEDELCILFRNNHFYTMLKHENELYTLVTDLGYLLEQDLVWERLDEINGDSVFITSDFKVSKSYSGKNQARDQQLDAFSDILDDVFGME